MHDGYLPLKMNSELEPMVAQQKIWSTKMEARFSNFFPYPEFLSMTSLIACGIIIKYHMVWKYMRPLSKNLEGDEIGST